MRRAPRRWLSQGICHSYRTSPNRCLERIVPRFVGQPVGICLGRLAGLNEDLGVIVQDCETADYAALGMDIALVVKTERLSLNLMAYQRLLGAGINVICHGSESYFPQGADLELA